MLDPDGTYPLLLLSLHTLNLSERLKKSWANEMCCCFEKINNNNNNFGIKTTGIVVNVNKG